MPTTSLPKLPADRVKKSRAKDRKAWSRRSFLAHGTGIGAVLLTDLEATAREIQTRYLNKLSVRSTRRGQPTDPALLRLVDRMSFGFARDAYSEAELLGFEAYREQQLDYELIDDSTVEAMLAGYDTLDMPPQEVAENYADAQGVPVGQLIDATILRAIYSKRQLYERMVEFWTDHFSIDINDSFIYLLKTTDDREVIRPHAMTSFPDLLNASARSAAMSEYLDNYANVKGNAQENYARELMELHTLGVDNGYTQIDVQEVARCFTGWGYVRRADGPIPFGTFRFLPTQHDNEAKTVLGQFIPAGGGEGDAQTVIDMLAMHPNTAAFIARKLCVHFLGYNAPEDVVSSVTDTYLATGGDIKSMLRVILQPTVITYLTTPKFKRPFHFVVSLLRAMNADVQIPSLLQGTLFVMGQLPFYWPQPDGYPDSLAAWGTSVLTRWQLATAIAYNVAAPNISIDLDGLLASEGGNMPGAQASAMDRILTGGRLSAEEQSLLQDFYDSVGGTFWPEADTFRLAASVPTFQWY